MSRDLNIVIIIGRLTQNPELKYTTGGTPIAKFSIANNTFYTQNNERKNYANFFDVVVWGNQAVNCEKYLKKGNQIVVEGRLRQNRWTDPSTNKTLSKIEIVANSIQFLTPPSSNTDSISQFQNNVVGKQNQQKNNSAITNPFDDIMDQSNGGMDDIYDNNFQDDNFGNGDDDIPF